MQNENLFTINFKEFREKLGLTQFTVSKDTNITQTTISRIENGNNGQFSNILKLYNYYNDKLKEKECNNG